MIQSDIAASVKSRLLSNNKKKKILFVDDEPDMTTILKMALERVRYIVSLGSLMKPPLKS
jgi:PleD family two-component response regulator